jgi:hypothetical protein
MDVQVLESVAIALSERSIPYMVIGDQALSLYSQSQPSNDIDITIGISPERLDVLLNVCTHLGIELRVATPESFANETYVLPTYHPASGLAIQFIFSDSDYEREAIARAREIRLKSHHINYATAEDVLIYKLIVNRQNDRADVIQIIRNQKNLDHHYILHSLSLFDSTMHSSYVRLYENIWAEVTA